MVKNGIKKTEGVFLPSENATPTKRWIYKSDDKGEIHLANKAQKIGGDTLYIKIKKTPFIIY